MKNRIVTMKLGIAPSMLSNVIRAVLNRDDTQEKLDNNIITNPKLPMDPEKASALVDSWLKKLGDAQIGHYKEAEYLGRVHQLLGAVLILLTTGVTAFIFYESANNTEQVRFSIGVASAFAAALSGVVTFGRFGERANEHRITAGRYGKLRRQLEYLQSTCPVEINSAEFQRKLKTLRIEWEYVALNAPLTPKERKISPFLSLFI
ncbi:SLATT domain-containing protein [Shewanella gelidimarina]|uniref:SLATT domain-containing protein n=1 Tax=Shewanella gelidimarina TaxID=56813 RepID=UPI0020103A8D|nr:SLATT domain-containing protein [Shewanella gelidimarina]MCL1060507.1 SLATT domain-containing protein [Shewanella gelidimarina]